MHVYGIGQPCVHSSGEGHQARGQNWTRTAPRADHNLEASRITGSSGVGQGSFLVTFPGEGAQPPRDKHTVKRSSRHFHLEHRGGPLKHILASSGGDGETSDTPYRYQKYSPRPETDWAESPADPSLPVCNLNKLNAMLDAEAQEHGDNLAVLNTRRGRGVRPRATYTRQIHNKYNIVENTQAQGACETSRDADDRRESKKRADKKEASLAPSTASSASTGDGKSGSFLRGSAIGGSEERPIRNRRHFYDARAFANKAARKRTLEKCNMEKFASLPNLSKSSALTAHTATGGRTVSMADYDVPGLKDSATNVNKHSELEKKSKSETKLPALSARSEVGFGADAIENRPADTSARSELADVSISNLSYSLHGSTSKGSSRARALSLKDMTEAFRKHMHGRFGGQSVTVDKRWVQKMSKETKVIDNNSYDIYARKPLPKYSVSKLALSQATQLVTMSTEDLSTDLVQDNQPEMDIVEASDNCETFEEPRQEYGNYDDYYYHNGCYPPEYYDGYYDYVQCDGNTFNGTPHQEMMDSEGLGCETNPQYTDVPSVNIPFSSEGQAVGGSGHLGGEQLAPPGGLTLVVNNSDVECINGNHEPSPDTTRMSDSNLMSERAGDFPSKGMVPNNTDLVCDQHFINYNQGYNKNTNKERCASSNVCKLKNGNRFPLSGPGLPIEAEAAE